MRLKVLCKIWPYLLLSITGTGRIHCCRFLDLSAIAQDRRQTSLNYGRMIRQKLKYIVVGMRRPALPWDKNILLEFRDTCGMVITGTLLSKRYRVIYQNCITYTKRIPARFHISTFKHFAIHMYTFFNRNDFCKL